MGLSLTDLSIHNKKKAPEEETTKRKQDDEDIVVDVTTCDQIQAFLDSDVDDDDDGAGNEQVFYLPSLPFDGTEGDTQQATDQEIPLHEHDSTLPPKKPDTPAKKSHKLLELEDGGGRNLKKVKKEPSLALDT